MLSTWLTACVLSPFCCSQKADDVNSAARIERQLQRACALSAVLAAGDDQLHGLSRGMLLCALFPASRADFRAALRACTPRGALGELRALPKQAVRDLFAPDGRLPFIAVLGTATTYAMHMRVYVARLEAREREDARLDRLRLYEEEARLAQQPDARQFGSDPSPALAAMLAKLREPGARVVLRVPRIAEVKVGTRVVFAANRDGLRPGSWGTIDENESSNPWVKWDGKSRTFFDVGYLRIVSVAMPMQACPGGVVPRGVRVMLLPGARTFDSMPTVKPGHVGTVDQDGSTNPWVLFDGPRGSTVRPYFDRKHLVAWGPLRLLSQPECVRGTRVALVPSGRLGDVYRQKQPGGDVAQGMPVLATVAQDNHSLPDIYLDGETAKRYEHVHCLVWCGIGARR